MSAKASAGVSRLVRPIHQPAYAGRSPEFGRGLSAPPTASRWRMCKILSRAGRPGTRRMDAEKTFCEFFAGIGLVGEGLRPSGWACVYANDLTRGSRNSMKL